MKSLLPHILGTYHMTRVALCTLGFLLPLILMFGGRIRSGIPMPTHSMSAYYHLDGRPVKVNGLNNYKEYVSSDPSKPPVPSVPNLGVMRNLFVGFLFAIGILLFAYKGYTPVENVVLNVGGLAAWCVAVFPMDWPPKGSPEDGPGFSISMHGASAAILFLCIAYVCIFRALDTLSEKEEKVKIRYTKLYRGLGWAMGLFPLIAWVLNSLIGSKDTWTFWLEATGVSIFSAYWLAKTLELKDGNVDHAIACGHLRQGAEKVPLWKPCPLKKVSAPPGAG